MEQLGSEYIHIVAKQLVGILLLVFAKISLKPHIKHIQAAYLSTGMLGGLLGNKGATAVRFRIKDSIITLVNSHLAADASMVDRRNADFAEQYSRLVFPIGDNYNRV